MPGDPGCIGELEHDLHKAFAAARVPSEASTGLKSTRGCGMIVHGVSGWAFARAHIASRTTGVGWR